MEPSILTISTKSKQFCLDLFEFQPTSELISGNIWPRDLQIGFTPITTLHVIGNFMLRSFECWLLHRAGFYLRSLTVFLIIHYLLAYISLTLKLLQSLIIDKDY